MNELTDEQVIGRVRAALDEAHDTEPAVALVARSTGPDRREVLRWVGIAAAGAVVLGAVGWAVTRPGNDEPVATLPEPPATTVLPATTTTEPVAAAPWFVLASPDLVPGEETTEQWGGSDLHQAWEWADGDEYGLVTATIVTAPTSPTPEGDYLTEEVPNPPDGRLWILTPNRSDTPNADSTALDWGFEAFWARSTGEVWLFRSVGLSKDALVRAVASATPGSGVPIVIADPSARLLGLAGPQGSGRSQSYTSTADGTEVVVRTGEAVLLGSLSGPDLELVTVAGRPGWQTSNPFDGSGRVVVMWEVGNGTFGQLLVPAALADRVPGLIAAIAEVPGNPARPVPTPDTGDPGADGPRWELTSADLVRGDPATEQWTSGADSIQAWEVRNGDVVGILTAARIVDPDPALPQDATLDEIGPVSAGRLWLATFDGAAGALGPSAYWQRPLGELWLFRQAGLPREVLLKTILDATDGSTEPIVLTDPTATPIGSAVGGGGTNVVQQYTSTSGGGQVTVRTGGPGLLEALAGINLTEVTVAGHRGWLAGTVAGDGTVLVVWDAGDGVFGQLVVPPALAERADELIAAVTESPAD
jgi:hypothetical protein